MIVKTLEIFKTQICSVIVAAAQNNTAVRAAKILMELMFVAADWDKINCLLIKIEYICYIFFNSVVDTNIFS